MTDVYVRPEHTGHADLLDAIERNDDALPSLIVGAALDDDDRRFVEDTCIRLSTHENEIVRGNATLAFGHLARRFGEVSAEGIAVVTRGLRDVSRYVRGQAEAAADDVEFFLGVDLERGS